MALWKPLLGNRTALDAVEKHAGYVYWCADDGSLHFDYTDADGNLQRKQINAKDAETLTGMSLEQIQKSISWNDLLDPPFYEEITITNALAEQTLTWETAGAYKNVGFTPTVGKIYIVHWNGVDYERTSTYYRYAGSDIAIPQLGEDGVDPFYILGSDLSALEAGTHTFSIDLKDVYIKTIEDKYIPDTILRTAQVNELELITTADIDTICGGAIQYAEDVMF